MNNEIDNLNTNENSTISNELIERIVQNRFDNSEVDFEEEDDFERLKIINTLFKILTGIYGSNFSNQYDNDFVKDLWYHALLEFTTEEIANGIEVLFQDDDVYTPNLKKIMKCFREQKRKKKEKENQLPRLIKGKNNY